MVGGVPSEPPGRAPARGYRTWDQPVAELDAAKARDGGRRRVLGGEVRPSRLQRHSTGRAPKMMDNTDAENLN